MVSYIMGQPVSRFNFKHRYIDDVLSINNPEFEKYVFQMYHVELEINNTTENNTSFFFFINGYTPVDREGRLTSHFHLLQT